MTEKCVATCRDGSPCGAYPVTGEDKCRMHLGKSVDGSSHDRNQNARSHGLHSTPEYLLEDLSERHLDTYHATFEALCSRYERIHGYKADFAAKKRLTRVSVEIVKEDLVDEYLRDHAEEDQPLVEKQVVGYDEESGQPQEIVTPNKLLPQLTQLKRETRLTLKDMGLLEDPETKKAEAADTFFVKLAEAVNGDG